MNILLVDDDQGSRRVVAKFLQQLGHVITECENGKEALEKFVAGKYPMVLTDVKMPYMSGIELLQQITSMPQGKESSVVLFTGHGDMDSAIVALRAGAYDYLLKPINVEELAILTERIAGHQALYSENRRLTEHFEEEVEAATQEMVKEVVRLKKMAARSVGLDAIGIFSDAMRNIVAQAQKYHTDRNIPVMIQGETGTGKEVIARLVHFGDMSEGSPFMDINCAAITPSLFESEMFGYESGAFTSSLRGGQKGKVEMAAGGTLFLDEVAEIPLDLQGKLLRVIQEKEFYRVGGTKKISIDVRIICATNVDLEQCVQEGRFRRDLYYRLKVGHIMIPPLRDRKEEVLLLANHFLTFFSQQKKKHFFKVGDEAAQIMLQYPWHGNIRELKNTMEWVVFMYDDVEVKPEHLGLITASPVFAEVRKVSLTEASTGKAVAANVLDVDNFALPKERIELDKFFDRIVYRALELHGGNKTKTANYLGLSRSSLACRLKNINERLQAEGVL